MALGHCQKAQIHHYTHCKQCLHLSVCVGDTIFRLSVCPFIMFWFLSRGGVGGVCVLGVGGAGI